MVVVVSGLCSALLCDAVEDASRGILGRDAETLNTEVAADRVDNEERPAEVDDHGENEVSTEVPKLGGSGNGGPGFRGQ